MNILHKLQTFGSMTGGVGYACSSTAPFFCDHLLFVATVGPSETEVSSTGQVTQIPVLNVVTMADRYGVWKAD